MSHDPMIHDVNQYAERAAMASKTHTAYIVVYSSGTYGATTPYAVVSTASGMPHMPAHGSQEAAQQVADRLNDEARRTIEDRDAEAAAQRKVARLQEAALKRDDNGEDAPA